MTISLWVTSAAPQKFPLVWPPWPSELRGARGEEKPQPRSESGGSRSVRGIPQGTGAADSVRAPRVLQSGWSSPVRVAGILQGTGAAARCGPVRSGPVRSGASRRGRLRAGTVGGQQRPALGSGARSWRRPPRWRRADPHGPAELPGPIASGCGFNMQHMHPISLSARLFVNII